MPIIEMKVPHVIFYNGEYLSPKEVYRRRNIARYRTGKKQPTATCPHCGKTFGTNVINRWHNDNCKKKV